MTVEGDLVQMTPESFVDAYLAEVAARRPARQRMSPDSCSSRVVSMRPA